MRRFLFRSCSRCCSCLRALTRPPIFPRRRLDLNITCAKPIYDGNGCMICHTSNNGGFGTATHPFGAYMKSHGLAAFNETELMTLLLQLDSEAPHTTGAECWRRTSIFKTCRGNDGVGDVQRKRWRAQGVAPASIAAAIRRARRAIPRCPRRWRSASRACSRSR
jgi:hypothetical protein